jgi:hypothetical protein
MKTGPDALGNAENVSGCGKRENGTRRTQHRQKRVRVHKTRKRDPTPSIPPKMSPEAMPSAQPKMSPGAQNLKTAPDAPGTAENMSGHAKRENGTRRPRHRRERVRERKTRKRDPTHSAPPKMSPDAQKLKKGPDALGTVEIESGNAKLKNGT